MNIVLFLVNVLLLCIHISSNIWPIWCPVQMISEHIFMISHFYSLGQARFSAEGLGKVLSALLESTNWQNFEYVAFRLIVIKDYVFQYENMKCKY